MRVTPVGSRLGRGKRAKKAPGVQGHASFYHPLCMVTKSYEVTKFLHDESTATGMSTVVPLTPKESQSGQNHTVLDLYDPLGPIKKEAELRSIKLDTLSMEAYFQKIDSLVTILISLGSLVNEEDVVHYAVEGLPEKYNKVCGYMHYQDTFPNLKTTRSLLIADEMRLKSKELTLPVDSSSFMVLMAQSGLHDVSGASLIPNTLNTSKGDEAQIPSHAAHSPTVPPNITHPDIIPDPPVKPNPTSVYPMVTRFRVGSNKATQRLNFHVSFVSPLPKTYRDAFHDSNWQNAIRDEYNTLIKNSTWILVPRPLDANVVRCMWLFRHKFLADGTLSHYKALLVVVLNWRVLTLMRLLVRLLNWDYTYGTFLSQCKYDGEIFERAGMVNCNPSQTPVDTKSKLGANGDPIFDLTLYRNADWAGCPTTKRFTLGYCVFLGNNLLSWSSNHQPTLSRSSAKAEYRGVANAVAETCWLRNLLRELHNTLSSAILAYCDNDLVAAGQVRVLHVPSRYQYADIFTKGLPSVLFEEFRSSLSVWCPSSSTAREC
nr:ribonuclease H-like domain-containing protein [Tanacetum cinerariifolium]